MINKRRPCPLSHHPLINAALGHLVDLPDADRAALTDGLPSLLDYLAWVPDPRDPRGVRHTLVSLLGLAAAAVLAGSQGFTAIGEWIWDASPQVLAAFGVRRDPLTRRYEPPDEGEPVPVLVSAAGWDAMAQPDVWAWMAGQLAFGYPALLGPNGNQNRPMASTQDERDGASAARGRRPSWSSTRMSSTRMEKH